MIEGFRYSGLQGFKAQWLKGLKAKRLKGFIKAEGPHEGSKALNALKAIQA